MESLALVIALIAILVAVGAVGWAVRRTPRSPTNPADPKSDPSSLAQQVAVALDAQMRKVATQALTDNNEQFLTLATERF
ncbi:uncharacterized protein METZ01_LOCUS436807, partial [marine metagenome]